MSMEQDITFGGSPDNDGLFQGTAVFQNNETLEDMQCFGFVGQNIPDYLLSWEWGACYPINQEMYPFPAPPSEPSNFGQQTYCLLNERSFDSPPSLVQESDRFSVSTEAYAFSNAFGLGILSGSDNSQPVQSPLGPNTSQQGIDMSKTKAPNREGLPKSSQDHQDEPVSSGISDTSRTEVRQPKTDSSRGRRHGKNAKIRQLLPVTEDQQGRERRKKLGKDKREHERIKLERNRQAAARCRDRKRDLANALNFEMEELRDRHQQLSSCYNELRSEVNRLRNEILQHGDCDCDFIRCYILTEANRTVEMLTGHDRFLGGSEDTAKSNIGRWQ